ncbi:MAG: right-handed parallel beta-helix repeat-containing protein, partial [Mucilaginibacter sp.]
MKKTALTPWRSIVTLAGMALLGVGACKKDVNVTPADTSPTNLAKSVDFKQHTLASLTSYKASAVINYTGQHDITISGLSIKGGTVPSITLSNCYNVHITQCSLGNSTNVAINLYNCYNITIDYNYFTNCSTGVYVVSTTKGGIVIQSNQFYNMQGPYPRGQAVQFNTVSGAGNSVSYNIAENIAGQSNTYESVNMYKSNGTAASPITITGNWFRGGGPNASSAALQ